MQQRQQMPKLHFASGRHLIDPARRPVAILLLVLLDPALLSHPIKQKVRRGFLRFGAARKIAINEFVEPVAIHIRLAQQPEQQKFAFHTL
jgi:hypothetical protein